jgi:hypothetical protein
MLLFLGAGASSPFGIPTMSGFLKFFDQKIVDSQLYQTIKTAFGNECDLEILMTVAEDLSKSRQELFRDISPQTAYFLFQKEREEASRYVDNENTKTEAKELLWKIKAIIRKECIEAASNDSKTLSTYDDFFASLEKERKEMRPQIPPWGGSQVAHEQMVLPSDLRIFTTNYDNCIEAYFNRKEIDFSRGISSKYGENLFEVDSYDSSPQTREIRIYKLHGSVDLFEKNGKIRQLTAARAERTFLGEEYGNESMRWPIEFGGYRQIIESPYLELFGKFRDAAKAKDWWIIVGFSFRDRTICSLLNDVLGLKPERKRPNVLLLDCHPEPIVRRLEDWGYPTLANTINPIEVEFGSKDLSDKLHEALVAKGYTKEMQVSTG